MRNLVYAFVFVKEQKLDLCFEMVKYVDTFSGKNDNFIAKYCCGGSLHFAGFVVRWIVFCNFLEVILLFLRKFLLLGI